MKQNIFIENVLPQLGFKKTGKLLTKSYGAAKLIVDIANKELKYPEDKGLKIHERQTCNFSSSENFVVFECVHQLLEKGYQPKHIELEPKWKLGHGASGGRADILVRDNQGKPLLIIECKTAGREFNKHWKHTLQDGDQLFSYAHQEPETQFLCLYASDWADDHVDYQSHVIALKDNEKYLTDNPSLLGFKDATDQASRFNIWRDSYKLDYTPYGLFEPSIAAYHIGKDKYSIDDLKPISSSIRDGQYHQFATILRQHNVSGRENAFDKLVNLLLCKLVDETENPQELSFYWKGVAYDTHFELLDRLQQLYQRGMKKFLGEEITYIGENDVNNSLRFIRQNPDATQRAVWNLFIQQKFFTNNDFSLIDVHNEKLFYQNAEILLKIIQMWQEFRLIDPENPNQFLGDMFEFFLDQGVKQSEGQFFTPMPICRFLIQSLPLENLITTSVAPPKAIDYACGSGHFLNELALQFKPIIENHLQESGLKQHEIDQRLSDYRSQIYGIEKEYRLSKISKVSAFMYQQPEIQLAYADGLAQELPDHKEIKNGSFDILVANPPYSVKGFLETLSEEDRASYSLNDTVNDISSANSIETFFIERAVQLLAPGGVSAIVLPASIISNGGSTYTRAREILLQNFDIIAITEFGSGTFGKTGTNTTTLFLRRKANSPAPADHYRDRVEEWFKGSDANKNKATIYEDSHLLDAYARHCEIEPKDYKTLLEGNPTDSLLTHTTFASYCYDFNKLTVIKNLKKQQKFKSLSKKDQESELKKRLLSLITTKERDKLLHFLLAHSQETPVLILKSPTGTKERKAFLGYDWSTAKGDEGIKLTTDEKGNHLTPLYDPSNRHNPDKAAAAIAANFRGDIKVIPTTLKEHASLHQLENLLDFSRKSFEKQLSLTPQVKVSVKSKWSLKPLNSICEINPESGDPAKLFEDTFTYIDIGSVESGTGIVNYDTPLSVKAAPSRAKRRIKNGDLLLSSVRPNLKAFALLQNLPENSIASTGFFVLRGYTQLVETRYLYELLFTPIVLDQIISKTGKGQYPSINRKDLNEIQIPLPPTDIQQKIITECQSIDTEIAKSRSSITKAQSQIDTLVTNIQGSRKALKNITSKIGSGATPRGGDASYKTEGLSLIRSQNVYDANFTTKGLVFIDEEQAAKLANVEVLKGDILLNITGASVARCCVVPEAILPARVNQHVAIIRPDSSLTSKFVQACLSAPEFKKELLQLAGGSVSREALTKTQLEEFKIPVPSPAEQKKIVSKIQKQETIIAAAEAQIKAAPNKKSAILKKHLE